MSDDIDRRSSRRTTVPGTAIVLRGRETSTFAIENVSASGALLVGEVRLSLGERVRLLLHIDGQRSLGCEATVARVEDIFEGRYAVAVRYHDLDRSVQIRIESIVRHALERRWILPSRVVLVIDDDDSTATAVERDVRSLGWAVVRATTSLEVVRCLNDCSHRIQAALVDACLKHVKTTGILSHLSDEHPMVRRVLISKQGPGSTNESGAMPRAQVLLPKPWERLALMEALGACDKTDKTPVP